ncbi:MAG TPA: tetratricopeptide repeat protein [Acidimicrobiia bacterium]|nr:tetratricopeptide repeat protein [Acidimicrobiia bacterium]
MSPSTRFDPDALASLESERDFLLRSIADLETEREAGNLDDERYRALKDDYTARAAAVLRSIEEGRDAPPPAPVPKKRRLLTGGAVVAFVVVAGLLLNAASGKRHDGQTITGNAQSGDARRASLERQVREHPDDAAAHLVFGRYLVEVQDWPEAVKQYLGAAKLDPKNPEANAYAGWMLFQVAQSPNADDKTRTELTDGALGRLDAAVSAADDYPDAHFFRGMVHFRGKNNPKAAIPDFERYLALVPNGPLNAEVQQILDQARRSAG